MKGQNIRQLGIITKFIEASSCWFIEFIRFWIRAVWLFGKNDGSGQHWNVKGKTEWTMGDSLFYLIQCETGNMHNLNLKAIPLSGELCWTSANQEDKFWKTLLFFFFLWNDYSFLKESMKMVYKPVHTQTSPCQYSFFCCCKQYHHHTCWQPHFITAAVLF